MNVPLVLGIETSCDETAAAVVRGGTLVLSNIIATQHDLHERYAGVVPEIASRAHIERIIPVIREAMREAGAAYDDLDAIAVGHRPGLIGSLLVGVSAAKALAWSLSKPLIGVDHVAAHLHAPLLVRDVTGFSGISYPALGLVVSGGHTSIFHLRNALDITLLGRTIDDAVGEAYDKAATMLMLGYPGGPKLDALAQQGNDRAVELPVPQLGKDRLDFSFSGLKTALLYAVCGKPSRRKPGTKATDGRTSAGAARTHFTRDASTMSDAEKADFAASFQRAAITAVMRNVKRALDRYPAPTLLVGGGVSANSRLRTELAALAQSRGIDVRIPEMEYTVDNAAMIAGYAAAHYEGGRFDDLSLSASTGSAIARRPAK